MLELALSRGRRQKGILDKRNFLQRQFRYDPHGTFRKNVCSLEAEGKCRIESSQNDTFGPNYNRLISLIWFGFVL